MANNIMTAPNLTNKYFVVCDGNSLTYGTGAANRYTGSYPAQLKAMMASLDVVINFGVSGQTIAQMEADAATQIDVLLPFHPGQRKVLVGWEGTNALYFGQTPAQTITTMTTYYTNRKAAGWKVIAVSVLPDGYASPPQSPTFEADRLTINTWMRNGARIGVEFDGIADIALDSRIGDDGDYNDATYYASDKEHMVAGGYAVVASIVKAAIDALTW